MNKDRNSIGSILSLHWKVSRIFFVIFSLYLTGFSFHRWDGFKYYLSLFHFLSGTALVLILWGILALILPIFILPLFKMVELSFRRMGKIVRIEHVLLFIGILMFLGILFWKGGLLILHHSELKNYLKDILSNYGMDKNQLKFIFMITAALIFMIATVVVTILFRNKAVTWISIIHERITPLVWLFGIFAVLSVILVAYDVAINNTWGKEDKKISPGVSRTQTSLSNKNKPNIIIVTFDALTSRNMSLYGYPRETTPFITEWAKNASVFTMTEAISNYTTPTTATLMTGKRMWTHQLLQPYGYKAEDAATENLPLLLKNAGYYNIALNQNSFASVNTLGIAESFDLVPPLIDYMEPRTLQGFLLKQFFLLYGDKYHLYNRLVRNGFIFDFLIRYYPHKVSLTEYPVDIVFNSFLELMDNNLPEPFFAWIHLFPPHDPYLPPEPFMGMFDSSAQLRTEKSQWFNTDFDAARARYDEFIRYCDKEFENFITELTKYDKETVIVLSADHGHSFEHGFMRHGGGHLYEQLTNIPLVIKEPYQTEGRTIDRVVEQIDIAPTILEFANIPVPSWMEGQSLVPLMQGQKFPSKPALSMVLESTPRGQMILEGTFALWDANYKLIHYLKKNKSLLFDLNNDPGEKNNLINEKPEVGQRLLKLILDNLEKANEQINRNNHIPP